MKTFRFIGMALFAVLMCVNFASCSSSEDDPTEEPEEGDVVVSGKKIAKIVGTSEESPYSETYTFSYDSKGRLIEATEIEEEEGYGKDTETIDYTELEREIERLKAIVEGTKENRNELQEEIK